MEQEIDSVKPNTVTLNCTVAYMSECMSYSKCKASCHSMGASSYRWFHDGCCECVGGSCIKYGNDESRYLFLFIFYILVFHYRFLRCLKCPNSDDSDDPDMENVDYGDDDFEN